MGSHSHSGLSHDFELNLTPIIDCFVTLICFLLLSASYVNLVGLEAKVPIAVPASSASAPTPPKFKLELTVTTRGLELTAMGAGAASGKKLIPNVAGKPDYAALNAALAKVKTERPQEVTINFTAPDAGAGSEMKYDELVQLMQAARTLPNGKDGTLFPDFIMANLGAAQGVK